MHRSVAMLIVTIPCLPRLLASFSSSLAGRSGGRAFVVAHGRRLESSHCTRMTLSHAFFVGCRERRCPPFSSSILMALSTSTSSVKYEPLSSSQLRWKCDPNQFDFKTTADLDDLDGLLGQDRAQSAIEFGMNIRREGYNLYVLGPSGSGKRTVIQKYLEKHTSDEPKPSDWVYVNNFNDTDKPKALRLPTGLGRQLEEDVIQLIEDIQVAIPAALEAEEHRFRVKMAEKEVFDQHEKSLAELADEANRKDLVMIRTPTGIALAGPSNHDERQQIPPEKEEAVKIAVKELEPKLQEIVEGFPQLKKMAVEKVSEINKEAARKAIEFLFSPLKQKYADLTDVVAHFDAVETDVIEHSDEIRPAQDDDSPLALLRRPQRLSFDKYKVNLFIDNTDTDGAPVIYEDYPYYHNLIGRVEHVSQLGSLMTDFSLIKPGALHRANGGYLVVHARDVLMQPFAWEALKRALLSGEVRIESMGAEMSLISTVSLQPEPIELDAKVVLLGDRMLYYLLQAHDPDFDELFKVAADFNDEMDRSAEANQLYARMLASAGRAEEARPMDRDAVSAMIEQAARRVGDQEKISTHVRSCADLLRESDYWAGVDGVDVIGVSHVQKAIDQQIYRADRVRDLVYEQIQKGSLLVDVTGEEVGQVNGLSVMVLGKLAFGRPSRITATARMGRGKVLDIEREVELGGPTHSKGVMILTSLLASRYAQDCPLSLSASLVFEQSYGMVEGDSASMAELCALLSALSGLPIKQELAITGSVDQHGEAQPIGGATEKIEGFYDVCSAIGLTGDQGVLIPKSNAKHLMLRPDIVEAVDQGKFAVYTYENVDDAISLLTGVEAGTQDSEGAYPPDTVNFLVDQRLHELADLLRKFAEESDSSEE